MWLNNVYLYVHCTYLNISGTAANPARTVINHYSLLLREIKPLEVVEAMMSHNLLGEVDHKIILDASLDHIRNCYIVEHVRHMKTSNLLTFLNILKEIPDQEHLWNTIGSGKYLLLVNTVHLYVYTIHNTDHPLLII